jgi:hypothetical protein
MAANYDATEFVDDDFQAHQTAQVSGSAAGSAGRPPTREETESILAQKQQEIAELNRRKEEAERERSALEETRRRQAEFHTGRQEMLQNLTRGVGLLEEAEFSARLDAEQMAKTLVDLREALNKVQAIHEEGWSADNFSVELTRALTTLENARMEWNGARLKYPLLSGAAQPGTAPQTGAKPAASSPLAGQSFTELCRLGLALTWPLAIAAVLALALLAVLVIRR